MLFMTQRRTLYQQYSNTASPLAKTSKLQTWLYTLSGITAVSVGLWWLYWPHHTFPTSVAKILRQALWQESDKMEHDYQAALKFYLEAINECDRLSLDPISDEYTGIQLKIAEMYEKLGMFEEAHTLSLIHI